jgi:hypothetical protein
LRRPIVSAVGRILAASREFIEPSLRCVDLFFRAGTFFTIPFGEIDMPKATRVSLSLPAAPISTPDTSEGHPLVWISLFCGIGLLVSLIAILTGVQGVWF